MQKIAKANPAAPTTDIATMTPIMVGDKLDDVLSVVEYGV